MRGAAATAIGKIGTAEDGKALIPLLADESTDGAQPRAAGARRAAGEGGGPGPARALRGQPAQGGRARGSWPRSAASAIPPQADLFQELVQDPDPGAQAARHRRPGAHLGRARACPPSRRTTSARRTRSCGWPTASRSRCSATAPSWTRIVLSLPSRTLGSRSRELPPGDGPGDPPRALPYLNDPEAEIRATLCDIIASFGDPEAIPRLTPLINDPSQTVADRANRAVERLRRVGSSQGLALRTRRRARRRRWRLVAVAVSASLAALQAPAGPGERADGDLPGPVREGKALLEPGQLDAALAELQKAPDDPDSLLLPGASSGRRRRSRRRCPRPRPLRPRLPRGWQPPPAPEFKPEEIQAAQLFEKAIAARPEHGAAAPRPGPAPRAPRRRTSTTVAEDGGRASKKPPVARRRRSADRRQRRARRARLPARDAGRPDGATAPVEELIRFGRRVGRLDAAEAGFKEMIRRKKERETAEPLARYGDFLAEDEEGPARPPSSSTARPSSGSPTTTPPGARWRTSTWRWRAEAFAKQQYAVADDHAASDAAKYITDRSSAQGAAAARTTRPRLREHPRASRPDRATLRTGVCPWPFSSMKIEPRLVRVARRVEARRGPRRPTFRRSAVMPAGGAAHDVRIEDAHEIGLVRGAGSSRARRGAVPRQMKRPGLLASGRTPRPAASSSRRRPRGPRSAASPRTHSGTWRYSTVTETVRGGFTGGASSGPAVSRKA